MESRFAILVAERNRHVRTLLQRELEGEGYRVEAARNGREVLDLLATPERFDLLVMDEDIPDTGCPAVIKALRERRIDVPVIVHAFGGDMLDESEGRTIHVRKCEDTATLKAAVGRTLGRFYPTGRSRA